MKKYSTIALLMLPLSLSVMAANSFTINESEITVPAPKGFVPITDDMTAVKRIVESMADPVNDTLAYYISESEVPTAMAGDVPSLERTFILKVNKQLRSMTMGKNDFSQLKEMAVSQNQQILEEVKSQMPEHMKNMSQGFSREFDVDFALNLSQMIPLEPHYQSENALAYSMYINYGVTANNESEDVIVAATATFLNTSGVVLFLYSYASQDDLEWTRNASKDWAESVISSNSQPPAKSPGRGIDWDKVMEKGLVGAVVGGLFALLAGAASLFKRKKG
ncbi:MAG: hypothetical protein ISR40_06275 [Puniceicoccaceae bacterium]|nr:hypothetical protein [Puniceicoccaceae bacterium]